MSTSIRPAVLLAGFMLAAPVLAAPPAVAAPRTFSLVLIGDDGAKTPAIDVSDVQVGLSRTLPSGRPDEAPDQSAPDQASLNLDTSVLANAELLNWVGKSGGGASVQITVTSGGQTTLYLLGGITSWSLSASHSSSGSDGAVSMAISARHLTVNGIVVN